VNSAYAVLQNPASNRLSQQPKLAVTPAHLRFTGVGRGQKKSMTVRIESVGGPYTKFWMDDAPAPWLRVAEVKSVTGDPLPLEATLEATGGAPDECSLPIRIEDEKTGAQDEVSVRIQLAGSRFPVHFRWPRFHGFRLSTVPVALIMIFLAVAAGLLIGYLIHSLIPLWLLLGFSVMWPIEKWFGDPVKKRKFIGVFYRLILNLGLPAFMAFVVWSGIKLFSAEFMGSQLIGSLVFLLECAFLFWLFVVVRKNSWRWPSMKLTIAAVVIAFFVFSYAGVEPFTSLRDTYLPFLPSFPASTS
jgi:hypothetical protein